MKADASFVPFIGVPYKGAKFCRELVRQVLAAHGIPMPLVDAPSQADSWRRVPRARRLDVVVFNRGGQPAHVGVCLGGDRFLHVEEGGRSLIDRLGAPLWAARVEGFYRYEGTAACVS